MQQKPEAGVCLLLLLVSSVRAAAESRKYKMAVLKKFMFCGRLTTGAFVIGWIGLVLDVLILAGDSAALGNLDFEYEGDGNGGNYAKYADHIPPAVKIPMSIGLATTVISIVTHILLLWGANTKNRLLLLPWLIGTMMSIVVSFVLVIVFGFILAFGQVHAGAVAAVFIVGFLITGILLYLWLCILSLYQEFRDHENLSYNALEDLKCVD